MSILLRRRQLYVQYNEMYKYMPINIETMIVTNDSDSVSY